MESKVSNMGKAPSSALMAVIVEPTLKTLIFFRKPGNFPPSDPGADNQIPIEHHKTQENWTPPPKSENSCSLSNLSHLFPVPFLSLPLLASHRPRNARPAGVHPPWYRAEEAVPACRVFLKTKGKKKKAGKFQPPEPRSR